MHGISSLVKGFLGHHKTHLYRATRDVYKDRANQINEAPFQVGFGKRRRYSNHEYAILEGECGSALKPGCKNGWLDFCL